MRKNAAFQDFVKPILVLFIITAVVAALLGFVNSLTAPVIAENNRIRAEETKKAVLPGAVSFTEIDLPLEELGISGAFKEDNGKGYVLTASRYGYGGDVEVTLGLDADGKIVGIAADVSTETAGVGSKAGGSDYLNRFMGLSGSADSVDTITSATYSSTAVKESVNAMLKAFASAVKGGE